MKPSRLLVVGLFALGVCGMTQTAVAAPQSMDLASMGFGHGVLATLNSLFGTTTSEDSKASDTTAQPATVHADDPTCEPSTAHHQSATPHPQPATVDEGHGGGSDSSMLPSTSQHSSGLSWQSLLPGSIQ